MNKRKVLILGVLLLPLYFVVLFLQGIYSSDGEPSTLVCLVPALYSWVLGFVAGLVQRLEGRKFSEHATTAS